MYAVRKHLSPYWVYRYFPEDTTSAILFRASDWNLIKIIGTVLEKFGISFWGPI
jgi:hypothetical protein